MRFVLKKNGQMIQHCQLPLDAESELKSVFSFRNFAQTPVICHNLLLISHYHSTLSLQFLYEER